jgi:hypothetical protein
MMFFVESFCMSEKEQGKLHDYSIYFIAGAWLFNMQYRSTPVDQLQ